MFWNEFDKQETLERLKIKIETKLNKVNKIEEYKTIIESIKYAIKRETEDLRIERMNKLYKTEKTETIIKELKIEIKFNELANNLDIRLLQGSKKFILNIAYISRRKILKI